MATIRQRFAQTSREIPTIDILGRTLLAKFPSKNGWRHKVGLGFNNPRALRCIFSATLYLMRHILYLYLLTPVLWKRKKEYVQPFYHIAIGLLRLPFFTKPVQITTGTFDSIFLVNDNAILYSAFMRSVLFGKCGIPTKVGGA